MHGLNTPLTPLRFLERATEVHPRRLAVVDGDRRFDYSELSTLVTRFARALQASGIRRNDRVAFIGLNTAELLAAHFAVPLAGGVLVAINTRLSAEEVAYICDHSGASILIGDSDLLAPLATLAPQLRSVREIIKRNAHIGVDPESTSFDELLARGDDRQLPWTTDDENSPISINYTSGTTGRPKGVTFTHRGAYLNALAEVYHQGFGDGTRYLWTLPMFHCNGWCTTWGIVAVAGLSVCLPEVRGPEIWRLIDEHRVDHLCGAPTVLSVIAAAPQAHPLDHAVTLSTAGAPPTPALIGRVRALGAEVIHLYGLTETYGPCTVSERTDEWAEFDDDELCIRIARQGVGMLTAERIRVVRSGLSATGGLDDVTPDGVEMGEIVMRGNSVMLGYHDDPEATAKAFLGGWFHSGDLGVMNPDGTVQLLDRSKDIIISGGENVSTIEVEQALASHPAVFEVAVIAVPDEHWGERPRAYVVLAAGADPDADALIEHVRGKLARFKAPREVAFVESIPKTSTGKVRKNELRASALAEATVG
ncbi:AMP-binding protein [uncultured Schumannella sp.]|uniref:AMP-binding protein n=1 Tax=uncultured Schumannella sp. TaxID=1195956 RepID=UPI0025E63708|nr:AMP-binding protein [uncultured Schumannella sp.]